MPDENPQDASCVKDNQLTHQEVNQTKPSKYLNPKTIKPPSKSKNKATLSSNNIEITQPEEATTKLQVPAKPPSNINNLKIISFLLEYISPDCSYDDWIKAGMVLHHETSGGSVGLHIWHEWSEQGEKYTNQRDVEYKYHSFNNHTSTKVTIGTLVGRLRPKPCQGMVYSRLPMNAKFLAMARF